MISWPCCFEAFGKAPWKKQMREEMYLHHDQKVRMRREKLRVHNPPLRACPNSLKTPSPVSERLLHFPKQKAREQSLAHRPSECSRPIQW